MVIFRNVILKGFQVKLVNLSNEWVLGKTNKEELKQDVPKKLELQAKNYSKPYKAKNCISMQLKCWIRTIMLVNLWCNLLFFDCVTMEDCMVVEPSEIFAVEKIMLLYVLLMEAIKHY